MTTDPQPEQPQVTPISSPPPHLTQAEYDDATSSTPQSFADIPPRLVMKLEQVTLSAQPALAGVQSGQGTLWVTEGAVSFLPSASSTGFSLPYPLLALHAVSSSVPDSVVSAGSTSATHCVYCQIDDAAGEEQDEGDDEEEFGLRELWLVPASNDDVEPLFAALSHCASLHPSIQDQDGDDTGGNPFAGMGPFGTGNAIHDAQQFDDADENGLSETGRHQLARLDALLGENEVIDEEETEARPSSPTAALPVSASPSTSNVIMVSSSPIAVPSLFSPPLLQSLLALLDAYLPVIGWDPNPEEGKMRVVFNNEPRSTTGNRSRRSSFSNTTPLPQTTGTQRIIDTLQGLPLETEREHAVQPTLKIEPLGYMDISRLLPNSLSSTNIPSLARYQPTDHLLPPASDRNFLISPPGSPPIGWEPIIEDPPNRDTLAGDLMDALKRLGREMQDDAGDSYLDDNVEEGEKTAIHIVVPPSDDDYTPAVTVQAYDEDGEQRDTRTTPPDITQVKATVESMRGADALFGEAPQSKRITPTGRPPLA